MVMGGVGVVEEIAEAIVEETAEAIAEEIVEAIAEETVEAIAEEITVDDGNGESLNEIVCTEELVSLSFSLPFALLIGRRLLKDTSRRNATSAAVVEGTTRMPLLKKAAHLRVP
jgi:cell division ATPase FtsA